MSRPPVFDAQDAAIVLERQRAYNARSAPEQGDWVDFADGAQLRIAHVWPDGVQTTKGGSFHFGLFGLSYSGALCRSVPTSTLALADGRRDGRAWIFHHDDHCAFNGVDVWVSHRVWQCTEPAPTW